METKSPSSTSGIPTSHYSYWATSKNAGSECILSSRSSNHPFNFTSTSLRRYTNPYLVPPLTDQSQQQNWAEATLLGPESSANTSLIQHHIDSHGSRNASPSNTTHNDNCASLLRSTSPNHVYRLADDRKMAQNENKAVLTGPGPSRTIISDLRRRQGHRNSQAYGELYSHVFDSRDGSQNDLVASTSEYPTNEAQFLGASPPQTSCFHLQQQDTTFTLLSSSDDLHQHRPIGLPLQSTQGIGQDLRFASQPQPDEPATNAARYRRGRKRRRASPISSPKSSSKSTCPQNLQPSQLPQPRGARVARINICSYCDKSFRRAEHLVYHIRTHTKEKPFVCFCGKVFSRKDSLKRHRRESHEGRFTSSSAVPQITAKADSHPEVQNVKNSLGDAGGGWSQADTIPLNSSIPLPLRF